MRKKSIEFEISESEEKKPTDSFIKSMEELQSGEIYRLENTQNPIAEILQ
jgi:hypothetical protein